MKILFLGVDGVLNIMSESYHSHSFETLGTDPIEPHLMQRLEFIIERVPDLKIVVSSSWGLKQLKRRLARLRFKYLDRLIDRTLRFTEYRGLNIELWLSETDLPVTSYVVLEDEVLDVCGERYNSIPKSNVVEVNMSEGLSNENCIQAIKILNIIPSDLNTDKTIELTSESYDTYTALGFRPDVTGSKEEVLKSWTHFIIRDNNLFMEMIK